MTESHAGQPQYQQIDRDTGGDAASQPGGPQERHSLIGGSSRPVAASTAPDTRYCLGAEKRVDVRLRSRRRVGDVAGNGTKLVGLQRRFENDKNYTSVP